MTKEQVLQKVNAYCNEKSYTSSTLTEGFKDKFATHFQKLYPDTPDDDQAANDMLKFAINTAFNGASAIITEKQKSFETTESELKRQIEELEKKVKTGDVTPSIPKEVQEQLDELKKFKDLQSAQEKFKNILSLAKKNVRQDLHKSLENYACDFQVVLTESDEEQAKKLTQRFQEIFMDSIGDIKPLAPKVSQKQDEELIGAIPKIKVC